MQSIFISLLPGILIVALFVLILSNYSKKAKRTNMNSTLVESQMLV